MSFESSITNEITEPLCIDDFAIALQKILQSSVNWFDEQPMADLLPAPRYAGEVMDSYLGAFYVAVLKDGELRWEIGRHE